MLHIVKSLSDPLTALIKDDPVRPEIPLEFRVSERSEILVLLDDEYSKPQAAVCVLYKDSVPRSVIELMHPSLDQLTVAVFYTIWSYASGAGRKLIVSAQKHITATRPMITTFVTLSPQTDMARVFHLRNGAKVLNVNTDTVNYHYE
jgi:hypothetical protein